jgi:uncharacterized coiled-coil DUF342 family protein
MSDTTEQEIQELKVQRSRLRAKVTTISKQLLGIADSGYINAEQYYNSLEQAYEEFSNVHFQYSEIGRASCRERV